MENVKGCANILDPLYLGALTTRHYFDMDNKLQALRNLLSLLAAVVLLISSFYQLLLLMCAGEKILLTVTVPVFSGTISPALIGKTLLMNGVVVQEEGQENFSMSRLALIYLNKKIFCTWRDSAKSCASL